jgi:hypothetical protein
MWQVVRDTRDGRMEANLFTDEWPNYTTVISQEIAPRLSEVLLIIGYWNEFVALYLHEYHRH